MDKKVLDHLATQRVCSLALVMPDGTSHSAAMHFVYHENALYFSTRPDTKKVAGYISTHASVVVGFSEDDWTTLQLDGEIAKTEAVSELILAKYPEAAKYISDDTVYLKFTPSWYRYTEFKVEPPLIIESHV